MSPSQAQQLALQKLALRIEPNMAEYLVDELQRPSNAPIPLMGGDARTGAHERRLVDPRLLRDPQ